MVDGLADNVFSGDYDNSKSIFSYVFTIDGQLLVGYLDFKSMFYC